LFNVSFAQDVPPVDGRQPLTWDDFQKTQEEILAQQKSILGTLFEIREQTRQININFLSWQTAKQDVLKAIGDNRGCNIWNYKYDPRSELIAMGLAIWGVFLTGYMGLSWFANLFKKKEVK
jgi:hypothetical protein